MDIKTEYISIRLSAAAQIAAALIQKGGEPHQVAEKAARIVDIMEAKFRQDFFAAHKF